MRLIKALHKWLSVFVGLQLLIWLGSGLFFNLMDHSKARGNEYRLKSSESALIEPMRLQEPSLFITQSDVMQQTRAVNSIKLITLLSEPYYLLNHKQGLYSHFYNEHSLINAYTGKQKIVDEKMARALASSTYSGMAIINLVKKISPPIDDFPKEKNTVWQINFADELLYQRLY